MRPAARIAPQPWMGEAAVRAVLAALAADGSRVLFVGGCVRDALLGRPIGDIDVATPDPPERVIALLERAGLKAVPTGLGHGTVTAVLASRHVEVTTLRRDVETFGRHARVAFTEDWTGDAQRRDFTMNALFLDADGVVFDPIGGLPDLREGRVRFVGDPETRIREDVLRLLRFYRFHAHYGRGAADGAARAACRALAPLLTGLSAERVAAELLRLLAAPDPMPTLRLMEEDLVLAVLLPEACRLPRLARLVALEPAPDALRRLAALIEVDAVGARALAERLRFSVAQRERLAALAAPPQPIDPAAGDAAQRRFVHRVGAATFRDLALIAAAASDDARWLPHLLHLAETWPGAAFPLRGSDVVDLGVPPGEEVGRLLAEVERWWEEGDFAADRQACLERLQALVRARRPAL